MPLEIPDDFNVAPIIALDPGADSTGLSIFMVNFRTGEILSIETYTLLTKKIEDAGGLDPEFHSERAVKISTLYHTLLWFFHKVRPVDVVSEAPFFNRLSPMAYGSLTEVVMMVRRAMIEYNSNLTLTIYPPMTVKQGVGATSKKEKKKKKKGKNVVEDIDDDPVPEKKAPVDGKQIVKEAVAKIDEIMNVLQKPLDQMTEHEIDSVAVGYTHLKKMELP